MTLLVTFPFCAKDCEQAVDLLTWCVQLGKNHHPALLVVDPSTPWDKATQCLDLAGKAFDTAEMVVLDEHVEGWIPGSNALFKRAAKEAWDRKTSWLFIEPDAAPIKPGWVDTIAAAYAACGKDYMGSLVSHQQEGKPSPYLEGVAVYPQDAYPFLESMIGDTVSWTFSTAQDVVPFAVNSMLFQHLWGEKNNPPTFSKVNIPGTNIHSLRQLHPEAVLFHRCKDGSLIRLLRERAGIRTPESSMLVAIPFCNKDVMMFVKNLKWWSELDQNTEYTCLMSYERTTNAHAVYAATSEASKVFKTILKFVYSPPARGIHAPTAAFIHTARAVQRVWPGPWLWTEYDMIPLKSGWMDTLLDEYRSSGRAFMGPIVNGMGHMNGTGMYPHDTPSRIPNAMRDLTHAWDMSMKQEMIHDCHDCAHLLHHVWVINRAMQFQPHGSGTSPTFKDDTLMKQILPTAVAFHRCKDGSLIDQLRLKKP